MADIMDLFARADRIAALDQQLSENIAARRIARIQRGKFSRMGHATRMHNQIARDPLMKGAVL